MTSPELYFVEMSDAEMEHLWLDSDDQAVAHEVPTIIEDEVVQGAGQTTELHDVEPFVIDQEPIDDDTADIPLPVRPVRAIAHIAMQ